MAFKRDNKELGWSIADIQAKQIYLFFGKSLINILLEDSIINNRQKEKFIYHLNRSNLFN